MDPQDYTVYEIVCPECLKALKETLDKIDPEKDILVVTYMSSLLDEKIFHFKFDVKKYIGEIDNSGGESEKRHIDV